MQIKKIIFVTTFLLIFSTAFSYSATLEDAIYASSNVDYNKALEILTALPKTSYVLSYLAWTNLRLENYIEASEIFSKLNQTDYETLFGLGLCYFLTQNYEQSFLYFKSCLEMNMNCAAAEFFCGEIRRLQKFNEEAIKHYQNTLKLDYNFIEAKLKLATIYHDIKKYDDSFREWSSILDIDPQYKEAEIYKDKVSKFITKKPEEIIPVKRIIEGSIIYPILKPEKIPLIRIGIVSNVKLLNLWSKNGILIYENNSLLTEIKPNEIITIDVLSDLFKNKKQIIIKSKQNNSGIIVMDKRYATGFAWAGISDREYRGYFEIDFNSGNISLINIINLEEYLYSVLPSEMISWWPTEALKAQAIVARTEALYRKKNLTHSRKNNYDLCDDQHCQVYKGITQETNSAREAVNSTRGQILTYNDKIIHALYSSNCSGHTQSSNELKGWGYEPYLSGIIDGEITFPQDLKEFEEHIKKVPNIYCAPSKYIYHTESRWIRVIPQEILSERFNRTYNIGNIKKIIPLRRSNSGHINNLKIEGTNATIEIEKENIIRSIALGKLRSTNFIVESYGKITENIPKYFIFWGAGWGHGVGLCQSGVVGMVEKGYKYEEILKKYYKNTNIKKYDY